MDPGCESRWGEGRVLAACNRRWSEGSAAVVLVAPTGAAEALLRRKRNQLTGVPFASQRRRGRANCAPRYA
jgi:hypothetical protein